MLLAEPQWRLSSDVRLAKALLFKPESAGAQRRAGLSPGQVRLRRRGVRTLVRARRTVTDIGQTWSL